MEQGPRAVRGAEFDSLRALTDVVFRPGMMDEYPRLFNEENRENLRVCVDGATGRCVSHVGMTEGRATIFGCTVGVGCVGAVSTLPEFRGRGLASACFDDAADKARRDGIDFLIISGDRSLYRRRGCLRVGGDFAFTATPDSLPADPSGVTIAEMTDDDLPLVMDCYRREPVRFLRTPADYERSRRCGFVMNRRSDFLVLRDAAGGFCGYLFVQRPRESERRFSVAEFAGDRHAVLAALPLLFRRYPGLEELGWQVQGHDHRFRSLCERAGLEGKIVPSSGTVKILHFERLMERMRPYFEEVIGASEAAKLSFRQEGDAWIFRSGSEERVTDRDTATRMIFGTPEGAEQDERIGALAEVLPLPCLWYGLNYV